MLQNLRYAFTFLTIFPLGKTYREATEEEVAGSLGFFPLVGLTLGALCLALDQSLLHIGAPQSVRAFLVVALLAALSRGLHLDGLADCFDALHVASGDKPRALEVLRDARVGAFGASALVLVLVGKFAALGSMPRSVLPLALLVVPALGRWTPAVVGSAGAPLSHGGLGYTFIVYAKKSALMVSALLALGISIGLALLLIPMEPQSEIALKAAALFAALSVAAALLTRYFTGALGGVTGDVFGAIIELSELLGFIAVPVLLS